MKPLAVLLSPLLGAALFASTPSVATPAVTYVAQPGQLARDADGWSAAKLLDLGHAYEAKGEQGRAVLAFERARLLAPRDPTVRATLARARDAAVPAPDAAATALERTARELSPTDWTWLALACGTLAGLGMLGVAWNWRPTLSKGVLLLGSVLSAGSGWAAAHAGPSPSDAIVVSATEVRVAPIENGEVVLSEAGGASVRIERQRGTWLYVRAGEQLGWLPARSVERIIQAHPQG